MYKLYKLLFISMFLFLINSTAYSFTLDSPATASGVIVRSDRGTRINVVLNPSGIKGNYNITLGGDCNRLVVCVPNQASTLYLLPSITLTFDLRAMDSLRDYNTHYIEVSVSNPYNERQSIQIPFSLNNVGNNLNAPQVYSFSSKAQDLASSPLDVDVQISPDFPLSNLVFHPGESKVIPITIRSLNGYKGNPQVGINCEVQYLECSIEDNNNEIISGERHQSVLVLEMNDNNPITVYFKMRARDDSPIAEIRPNVGVGGAPLPYHTHSWDHSMIIHWENAK